jgi:secreted trypsin-like serine protease
MLSRIARVGTTAICAAALAGLIAAGPAAGSPRARSSVIGARTANLQEWGFTVAVINSNALCTGEVLSPTKVLTAAHCVSDPASMVVHANSLSAFNGGEVLAVASAAIAPGFQHGFSSDIAVLTLKTPTTAPSIQLASPAEDASYTLPGAPLAVAGFGERNPLIVGKRRFGLLTAADVSAKRCPVPPWAICDFGGRAGTVFRRLGRHVRRRRVNRSICQGDSGGPLIARTPAGPRLIGIAEASTGPRKPNPFFFVWCGLKGFPGVHTRAASYRDFILANAGP